MSVANGGHEEAQSLLPWLANGTLTGAEQERVQAHLQGCAACRSDLAVLHTLRAASPGDAPGGDVDAAFARLLPQLDAPAVVVVQPAPPRPAANDRNWLRVAAGVQFCAIVVLGLLLARAPAGPGAHADAYRVLGAGEGTRHGLVIAFNPDTTERDIRRIVLASGARIVGGPTATGAWLLDTAGAPAAAIQRLRAEPAVTLAEPLDGPLDGPPDKQGAP
jgi:hypothetical protein